MPQLSLRVLVRLLQGNVLSLALFEVAEPLEMTEFSLSALAPHFLLQFIRSRGISGVIRPIPYVRLNSIFFPCYLPARFHRDLRPILCFLFRSAIVSFLGAFRFRDCPRYLDRAVFFLGK